MVSENGSFRTLTQAGFHGSRWWAGSLARCPVASEDGAGSCSSVLGAAETGGVRFSTAGVCPKMSPLPSSWQGDLSRQQEAGLLLTGTHPSSLVTLGTTGARSLHSSLLLRRLMRWSKLGLDVLHSPRLLVGAEPPCTRGRDKTDACDRVRLHAGSPHLLSFPSSPEAKNQDRRCWASGALDIPLPLVFVVRGPMREAEHPPAV